MSSDNANRRFIGARCVEIARLIRDDFDSAKIGLRFIVSLLLFTWLDHVGLRDIGFGSALYAISVRALLVASVLPRSARYQTTVALAVHILWDFAQLSRQVIIGAIIGMFLVQSLKIAATVFLECRGNVVRVDEKDE